MRQDKERKVYYETRDICTLGRARYRSYHRNTGVRRLSKDFKSAICRLPTNYTSTTKQQYVKLIDEWGTVRMLMIMRKLHLLLLSIEASLVVSVALIMMIQINEQSLISSFMTIFGKT